MANVFNINKCKSMTVGKIYDVRHDIMNTHINWWFSIPVTDLEIDLRVCSYENNLKFTTASVFI